VFYYHSKIAAIDRGYGHLTGCKSVHSCQLNIYKLYLDIKLHIPDLTICISTSSILSIQTPLPVISFQKYELCLTPTTFYAFILNKRKRTEYINRKEGLQYEYQKGYQ